MVVFPVVLLLIFGAVQTAVHLHARNVALTAASEAVSAGTTTTGTSTAARQAAQAYIESAGDGILATSDVTVTRTGTTVTATVTGHSLQVVPLVPTPVIRQTVSGTIEQPPA